MALHVKSDMLTIRDSTSTDLDFVLNLETDPDNARFIIPWLRELHEKAIVDPDKAHQIIETTLEHRKVGYIIMAGLQEPNSNVELTRITVAEKGRGYGKEAIRLIQRWAFLKLRAHRLWLDVKEHNHRARYVYRSMGFVEEGTFRECLRSAQGYESLVVMSMLDREYLANQ